MIIPLAFYYTSIPIYFLSVLLFCFVTFCVVKNDKNWNTVALTFFFFALGTSFRTAYWIVTCLNTVRNYNNISWLGEIFHLLGDNSYTTSVALVVFFWLQLLFVFFKRDKTIWGRTIIPFLRNLFFVCNALFNMICVILCIVFRNNAKFFINLFLTYHLGLGAIAFLFAVLIIIFGSKVVIKIKEMDRLQSRAYWLTQLIVCGGVFCMTLIIFEVINFFKYSTEPENIITVYIFFIMDMILYAIFTIYLGLSHIEKYFGLKQTFAAESESERARSIRLSRMEEEEKKQSNDSSSTAAMSTESPKSPRSNESMVRSTDSLLPPPESEAAIQFSVHSGNEKSPTEEQATTQIKETAADGLVMNNTTTTVTIGEEGKGDDDVEKSEEGTKGELNV